jgi:hypothetical protein
MASSTRIFWLAGVALAVFAAGGQAQYPYRTQPGFYQPPLPYSPYLNLLRPGNPAINYYGLVRPQVDFRNAIGTLGQQVGSLGQDVAASEAGGGYALPVTGHPVGFMNTGRYFGTIGFGRSSVGGVGRSSSVAAPVGGAYAGSSAVGPASGASSRVAPPPTQSSGGGVRR